MAMSSKRAALASIIAAAIPVPPAHLFRRFNLPAGFEAVDVAVLEWIVAQRQGVTSVRTGGQHFATPTNRFLGALVKFLRGLDPLI
jgi:hypothetical protein